MKRIRAFPFLAAIAALALASCVTVTPPPPQPATAPPPQTATPPVALIVTPAPLGAEPMAVPGSVLVRFKPGTPAADKAGSRAAANARLDKAYKIVPGLERLAVDDVESALRVLRRRADVLYAEPDFIVTVDETPGDPRFGELWGMINIKAPQAWDTFTGDPRVVVAVIDTGIDYTHPDLAANIWTNPDEIAANGADDDGNGYVDDVHGYDFANNDGDPMDDHFHGTHVAGTIGAVGDNAVGVVGVNWRVSLMAVKFLNASGSGTVSGAVSAIEYAARMGVRVSNNSWGGSGYSQALRDAIQYAGEAAGQLFVAAAGNMAVNSDQYPHYPAAYDLDNILSVAAIDANDKLAFFSNYGPYTVDLGAPGVNILSTVTGGAYGAYSGTSMATPHVAGVAALLFGHHPDWDYEQVRDQILATTRPLPSLANKTRSGGTLDAYNALANLSPGPAPTAGPHPPTPTPGPRVYSLQGEELIEGRKRGTYRDTFYDDGVVETLIEKASGGRNKYDTLEHRYLAYIPPARNVVLGIKAWRTASTDGDAFVLEYRYGDWKPLATISATTREGANLIVQLPPEVAGGPLFLRIVDTDQTPRAGKQMDSVYVDWVYVAGW